MLIHLTKSRLFTENPATRFNREYGTNLWPELWRRHIFLEYTVDELCDYFQIKTGRRPQYDSIRRWIIRAKIYDKAHDVMKRGAQVAHSEFFGELEQDVIRELTRGVRNSGTVSARSVV